MNLRVVGSLCSVLAQLLCCVASAADPRIQDITYDGSIITVATRVGVATAIELDPGEAISFAATGVGSECSERESRDGGNSWCIAAPAGEHVIFIKPRTGAVGENNLQIITATGRSYTFRLALLGRGDQRQAVYRLIVRLPKPPPAPPAIAMQSPNAIEVVPALAGPTPAQVVASRMKRAPRVANSNYTRAAGELSDDIVPRAIFDDGHFTYFRFAPNQELPSVFELKADGTELMVNSQMEGDLMRIDRVARQFYLRQGNQVVRVWNESFDLNGKALPGGTTVPGVERVIKAEALRELGEVQ